jgi:hypothetical protein
MASLTPCAQIIVGVVFRRVVEMGDGENHLAPGYRMRLAVLSSAIWVKRGAFATIAGSLKSNTLTDRRPLFRIPGSRGITETESCWRQKAAVTVGLLFMRL